MPGDGAEPASNSSGAGRIDIPRHAGLMIDAAPYLTSRGALLALGAAVLLCWPMLLTSAPLIYFDTISYYSNGAELWWRALALVVGAVQYAIGQVPGAGFEHVAEAAATAGTAATPGDSQTIRSLAYSAFVFPASLTPLGLVLPCLLQTAMTMWVFLGLVPPIERAGRRWAIGGFGAVATLSTLPWFASYAMPDLLGAVLPLYFALALGPADALGRGQRMVLGAIACFAILSHYGHVPLSFGLALAVLGWRGWRRRLTARGLAFCVVPVAAAFAVNVVASLAMSALAPPPMAQAAPPAQLATIPLQWDRPTNFPHDATVVRLLIAMPASSVPRPAPRPAAVAGPSLTPNRVPVLLARSIEDGPGRWYLQEACRNRARYAICELFGEAIPDSAFVLLWSDEGLRKATPAQLARIRAEESAIVFAAARRYPLQQAAATARNTARQLLLVGTGELLPWPAGTAGATITQIRPSTHDNEASMVMWWFDRITPLFTALAVAVLAWRLATGRTQQVLVEIVAMTAFALVINAAIYGGLSAPVDRYQSRLVWLIPALLALDLALQAQWGRRQSRLAAEGPALQ